MCVGFNTFHQHAKDDLLADTHACRHSDGGVTVPTDQFAEQTFIKRGKCAGGMKGISTSAEQVAVWVNRFSVCVPTSTSLCSILYDDAGDEKSQMAERTEMGRIGTRKNKRKRETG